MNITISDEDLDKFAALVAQHLSRINDAKLGDFLAAEPADEPRPRPYPAPPEPEVAIDPTPIDPAPAADKPRVTLELLRGRFQELSDKGLKPQLLDLLHRFDARTLPKVPEERYPALVAELDQLEQAA